jgi:hypothetical protein
MLDALIPWWQGLAGIAGRLACLTVPVHGLQWWSLTSLNLELESPFRTLKLLGDTPGTCSTDSWYWWHGSGHLLVGHSSGWGFHDPFYSTSTARFHHVFRCGHSANGLRLHMFGIEHRGVEEIG